MTGAADFDVISEGLADVHRRLLPLRSGEVASYIPQLALAGPDGFGIARTLLAREGHRIAVVAAQGELDFTAAERVLHELARIAPTVPGWVVVDLGRVTGVRPPARALLAAALARVAAAGHRVAVVGAAGDGVAADAGEELAAGEDEEAAGEAAEEAAGAVARYDSAREALAGAEDALLDELARAGQG